jgi:hypothetical protein
VICHKVSSLFENRSNRKLRCICLDLKWLLQIGKSDTRTSTKIPKEGIRAEQRAQECMNLSTCPDKDGQNKW